MNWHTHRWWIFILSDEPKYRGQMTVWTAQGRSVWCHVVGRLWVRTSFVPVKWARP